MPSDGYHTIAISTDAYERHKARKEELGVTWTEYIDGEAPSGPTGNGTDPQIVDETVQAAMDEAYQDYLPEFQQLAYEGAREAVQEVRR